MNVDDWVLLQQYVEEDSQDAFAELVRRHAGLVHASALRRVGQGLADDVTQAVFTVLAQKAPRLRRRNAKSLAGWLFRATRLAASQALRSERRRKEREHMALDRQNLATEEATEAAAWQQLRPVIDTALDSLNRRDREAILLRFFEGAAYADVGRALGTTENTATKRVARALEKLRSCLSKRDVMLSASVLSTILATKGAEAAAAGFVASTSASALATSATGAGSGGLAATLAHHVSKAMLIEQVKVAAVSGCALVAASTVTVATVQLAIPAAPPVVVQRIDPFPFTYKARSTLPDGTMQFQVNSTCGTTTRFVRVGERIGSFQVIAHTAQHEERPVPGLPTFRWVDTSMLTLQDPAGRQTVLRHNHARPHDAQSALLVRPRSRQTYRVSIGDTFSCDDTHYEVTDIDREKQQVSLRRISDGHTFVASTIR